MPLVSNTLAAELEVIFLSMPSTSAEAASKMAAAYDKYCKVGLAGGIPPVFTGTEVKRLEAILLAAIAAPHAGNPAVIASAWASGVNSYWLTPPVVFTVPPIVGATTVIVGAPSIIPGLTGVFSNIKNTAGSVAKGIAGVLHAATITTTVVFVAPPPPAGPPPPAMVL